jgi:DNA-directed RNA polymerase subunit RPC12/RpoP
MSLRDITITIPKFTTTVPSTKKKVKFRAFNVADEKALEGVEVSQLAPYDVEFLFVKLRTVSVGESATIGHACPHCNHQNQIDVDLSDVTVTFPAGHDKTIRITDQLGFEMKYPDMEDTVGLDTQDPESITRVIAASIKTVYNGDDVIDATQEPVEDVIALIDQLPSKQFKDIQNFFETMPKLQKDVKYTCKHCTKEVDIHLEGLADFF